MRNEYEIALDYARFLAAKILDWDGKDINYLRILAMQFNVYCDSDKAKILGNRKEIYQQVGLYPDYLPYSENNLPDDVTDRDMLYIYACDVNGECLVSDDLDDFPGRIAYIEDVLLDRDRHRRWLSPAEAAYELSILRNGAYVNSLEIEDYIEQGELPATVYDRVSLVKITDLPLVIERDYTRF